MAGRPAAQSILDPAHGRAGRSRDDARPEDGMRELLESDSLAARKAGQLKTSTAFCLAYSHQSASGTARSGEGAVNRAVGVASVPPAPRERGLSTEYG